MAGHVACPRGGPGRVPVRLGACAALAVGAVACELEQITIVDVEPAAVVEMYANLEADADENEIRAWVHWTAGIDTVGLPSLSDSRITIRAGSGLTLVLRENERDDCLESFPEDEVGACFLADPALTPSLVPGDLLEAEVELPTGASLVGAARLPTSFELRGIPGVCELPPNTLLTVRWSRSEGAWAYVNETSIRNLPAALQSEGIDVEEDPLYLLGLSISDRDTTIVFPSEFGIFNRFELDQDLAVRLQRGLPRGTVAEVTITAVDRNYVNWARGGNFNPSGQVRVPSLQGDGTGVFAATMNRRFIVISDFGGTAPPCPGS